MVVDYGVFFFYHQWIGLVGDISTGNGICRWRSWSFPVSMIQNPLKFMISMGKFMGFSHEDFPKSIEILIETAPKVLVSDHIFRSNLLDWSHQAALDRWWSLQAQYNPLNWHSEKCPIDDLPSRLISKNSDFKPYFNHGYSLSEHHYFFFIPNVDAQTCQDFPSNAALSLRLT